MPRSAPRTWTWYLVLAVLCAGCDQGEGIPSRPLATITVAEDQVVRFGPAVFTGVLDLALRHDVAWVVDADEPFVRRVELPSGDVASWLGSGEGPREARAPRALTLSAEGAVQAWDFGTGRALEIGPEGSVSEVAGIAPSLPRIRAGWENISYARPDRVRSVWGGVLHLSHPQTVSRASDLAAADVVWVSEAGGPRTLLRLGDHFPHPSDPRLQWAGVPQWDACGDRVVLWSPARRSVLWFDRSGQEVGSVPITVSPRTVERSDRLAFLRWMARIEGGPGSAITEDDISAVERLRRSAFARVAPIATDIRCESEGVVWLRGFDTALDPLGRGRRWLRVSEDIPQRAYEFPPEFAPLVFRGGQAVGTWQDGLALQRLARWEIDSPAPPAPQRLSLGRGGA